MRGHLIVVLICLLFSTTIMASDQLSLTITDSLFGDLQSENISLSANIIDSGLEIRAEIASLQLPAPVNKVKNIRMRCAEITWQSQQWQCESGQLQFYHEQLGQQNLHFKLEANTSLKQYRLRLTGLTILNSAIQTKLKVDDRHWQLQASGDVKSLTELIQAIKPYLTPEQQELWQTWEVGGVTRINLTAQGQNEQIKTAQFDIELEEVNVSDEFGSFVAEQASGKITVNATKQKKQWHWQNETKLSKGQAYIDPVFFDLFANPIQLSMAGVWHDKVKQGAIDHGRFIQHNIAQLDFSAIYANNTLAELEVEMPSTTLSPLYTQWIQPFTVGTASDSLAVGGHIEWQFKQKGEHYSLQGQFEGVDIEDETARFTIKDLKGPFAWTNTSQPLPLALSWQQAQLYSIPIGQSQFSAQTLPQGLALTQPWQVPILDGDLHINDFSLKTDDDKGASWQFEGVMTPISMPALSQQLGWPVLQGKLSGIIPKVSYQQQQIAVDGALMVKVFGGTTVIHDLTLSQLFGPIPQLTANIDLTGLDLDIMTSTFDFGKITGGLEGKIENLRLANWQPVYFDAYLKTPDQDAKPHRINQRAVNNLSNLGGGASGALSRSVLRFFEDFSYRRLGLSCRLRNETCEMTGVSPAERGYYIVEGGGLPPRIDVIGHTRRVDWPELLDRLKAVSNSPQAVME